MNIFGAMSTMTYLPAVGDCGVDALAAECPAAAWPASTWLSRRGVSVGPFEAIEYSKPDLLIDGCFPNRQPMATANDQPEISALTITDQSHRLKKRIFNKFFTEIF